MTLIRKGLTAVSIFLFVGTSIIPAVPFCSAETFHELNDYYFENVNIMVIGRCSSITSANGWRGGLFIGKQEYPGIGVHENKLERVKTVIYNESIFKPQISLSKMKDISIFMNNVEGIYFWSCRNPFHARPIPPIIFIWCHAEKLWIYNLPSY